MPKAAATLGHFPEGGFSFMRTGWEPTADHLALSHFSKSMRHGHTHWDMLSFQISSGDHTLIGDPATRLYQAHRDKSPEIYQRSRGYSYSVQAHNTLTINHDTLKTVEALGHDCSWGGEPPRHSCGQIYNGSGISLIEAHHDGYSPFRHRRFTLQLKHLGYATIDIIENTHPAEQMRPQEYQQYLHGDFGVQATPTTRGHKGILFTKEKSKVLAIPGLECEHLSTIQPDKMLKGVPLKEGIVKNPPPIAFVNRRIVGSPVFATFYLTQTKSLAKNKLVSLTGDILPYKGIQKKPLSAHEIQGRDGYTYVVICAPGSTKFEHSSYQTDAELAVLEYNPQGKVSDWCFSIGSFFKAPKLRIQKSKKARWSSLYE